MNRKECYQFIKDNSLQEEIKKLFGKNFTNVPTEKLSDFCKNYKTAFSPIEKETKTDIDYRKAVQAILSFLRDVDPSLFEF